MAKEMTFKEVEKILLKEDPNIRGDSENFDAARFLLSSAFCGTGSKALQKFTGWSASEVNFWKGRAKRAGLFENGKVTGAEWQNEKTGGIAFWCDVLVLRGMLKRA